jgi:hypothetical protein
MSIQLSPSTLWTHSNSTPLPLPQPLPGSATAMELLLLAQTLPMILCDVSKDVSQKEYSYHEYTIAGIPGNSL